MELAPLIESLSEPAAYPFQVDTVEVRHTHISVVFLAGAFAYKIKKPVNLGFLDFSSLDGRRHFCEEEVRLNRRLAPEVYLGVVPITRTAKAVQVEGHGELVEWAVKMKRLPDDATLERRLQRGQVDAELLKCLARKVASFHGRAETSEHISAFGHFDVVARNARENFEQAAPLIGTTISRGVFGRLRELTEESLARLRPLIESRAERGVPRDTHGDLHLDHVYLGDTNAASADPIIIDCIEFNERFHFADPVSDMAFLVMDLCFHGRKDLAVAFADEYFRAFGDGEGRALLSFYVAYRAAVRGKVEGFELLEKEVPEAERIAALTRARAHWLLALGELETSGRKPCLVLVGGLPGTGKSTLAQAIAEQAGFAVIRSDVVRKELAGIKAGESARSPFGEDIYAPAWSERTYATCLSQAEGLLFEGKRVLVDANFAEDRRRMAFLEAAGRLAVPLVFLLCRADPEVARQRLESRKGDVSDADWSVYQRAAERWENPGPVLQCVMREIATGGTKDQALSQALAVLGAFALR